MRPAALHLAPAIGSHTPNVTSRGPRIPAVDLRRSETSNHRLKHVCEKALSLFCENVLQHRLVERQVGDEPLELRVLFLKLLQPPHLRWTQPAKLLTPVVKRGVRDAASCGTPLRRVCPARPASAQTQSALPCNSTSSRHDLPCGV